MPISGSERLATLAQGRDGSVLMPGDDGYDEAKSMWNGRFERRPAVVARCASATAYAHRSSAHELHAFPGWLDAAHDADNIALDELVDDLEQHFYVCGPPGFVDDVTGHLRDMGVDADRVVIEE